MLVVPQIFFFVFLCFVIHDKCLHNHTTNMCVRYVTKYEYIIEIEQIKMYYNFLALGFALRINL